MKVVIEITAAVITVGGDGFDYVFEMPYTFSYDDFVDDGVILAPLDYDDDDRIFYNEEKC